MRLSVLCILLFLTACSRPIAEIPEGGKTYHVYFLGGQSNMEGWGRNDELPDDYTAPQESFPIYTGHIAGDHDIRGGRGKWAFIQPGFGKKFRSDGQRNQLSDFFGPEMSFSKEMKKLFPDQNIAVIKYARSGASLEPHASHGGNFRPNYFGQNGLNQYDFAVRAIRDALSTEDIDGDGLRDRLIPAGIVWMQGEADAIAKGPAQSYGANLRSVIFNLRVEMGSPTLPVIIGKITDSNLNEGGPMMPYIERVHTAKRQFVEQDYCAALMTETETYAHVADGWHYTSLDYLKMGQGFANALQRLSETCEIWAE